MMDLRGALAFVAGCLESIDRPWALVGALAVAARSEARATLDIDVAVAVDNLADSHRARSLIQLLEARDRVPKGRLGASLDRLVKASG